MKIPDGYRKREIGETVREGDMLYFKGDPGPTTTNASTWNITIVGESNGWKENYGETWVCLESLTTMKNPDTHPNEFRTLDCNERVPKGAISRRGGSWVPCEASVGMKRTRDAQGNLIYVPVPTPRSATPHNPDTHPHEFRRVVVGETVLPSAIYKHVTTGAWEKAVDSVGKQRTRTMNGEDFYHPLYANIEPPPPVNRDPQHYNRDTHPNDFHMVVPGETVLDGAIYQNSHRQWKPADWSVGRTTTHTSGGHQLYNPGPPHYFSKSVPPPVNREPREHNPDTHPQDFHKVVEGEVVSPNALYKQYDRWMRADSSVGKAVTHTPYNHNQFYNPNSIDSPPDKPKTESTNTMLVRTTIMHTPKVVPGQPAASEEILIGNTEVSATDGQVALLLLGAENAAEIRKAAKTSTLRIIQSAH